ncbi:MAG: group II truncated hemoglobin [Halopseudomonas sp.]|uniref:group II truncated hemoglobin n=1 Tax=Halopseudomonas sp. TaxID=2901191 RepID=UPI003003A42E
MVDAAPPLFGTADASYRAAGELAGIRRLVADFYQIMDSWPQAATIRSMHKPDLSSSEDKLACFLSGWLGGPRLYQERYGSISIPGFHAQWPVDIHARDAWLGCMQQAIERQPYSVEFKRYLLAQLSIPANRVVQASQARQQAAQ